MREACVFFFDIDAGGPKDHYATIADILNALEQFLFETCLPTPLVVCSGYGIHVYWVIDTPIESVAWKEPAGRLHWLAKERGLHVDPMRTTDQSSVLRVPGTFNFKDPANLQTVTILAEGVVTPTAEFLDQLGSLTSTYTPAVPNTNGKAASETGLSVAWDRRPSADEVAESCEHHLRSGTAGGMSADGVGIGTSNTATMAPSGRVNTAPAEAEPGQLRRLLPPPGWGKISRIAAARFCAVPTNGKDLLDRQLVSSMRQPLPGPWFSKIRWTNAAVSGTLNWTDLGHRKTKRRFVTTIFYCLGHSKLNESCLSRWYQVSRNERWLRDHFDDRYLKPWSALRNRTSSRRNKRQWGSHRYLKAAASTILSSLTGLKRTRRNRRDRNR
jgi:hypothetical protein